MKAPLSWLKDYVDIDCSPEELKDKLFSCGFEVEDMEYVAKHINRIVTCKILKIEKHPNADKLSVTQVDAGKYGHLQIITAATNTVRLTPASCAFSSICFTGILKQVRCRYPAGSGVPRSLHASFSRRLAGTFPAFFWKLSSISSACGSSRRLRMPHSFGIEVLYFSCRYSATSDFKNIIAPVPSVSEWKTSSAIRFLYTSMRKAHLPASLRDIRTRG